ncbi:MAG: SRPBCC domain-containing protein [Gemmatimonadetes bacterium]|nr:SRPBCC domain-containing protein [Gemmatimonadota bacterium]NIR80064.1 SRPBCC domain-containing protein [Gemmatimonadota bacterium]NIT88802.1 SRPBCC domain-containing protein [Gemmatimonadota bacterium]NIU32606.1 SRPBCC domain-containing protein [Gemmatimonadota bacterium]NIU37059.1 SRPBCC domain-containing protein [Gemmatimonadota bacterium]
MADIYHDFPIRAEPDRVFEAVSTPDGLDRWWTKRSSGEPVEGAEYQLGFGPEHDWRARLRRVVPDREIEYEIVGADEDWTGTRVGFRLEDRGGTTQVRFHHTGWPDPDEHYRVSSYCWAMYLRILRRYLEEGEEVRYEERLDA